MTNTIVILVLIGLIAIALRGSVKHFRGEGACCGGSSSRPVKKKLQGKVIKKETIRIDGMHCSHCAASVTRAINSIDGASAKVNLNKKAAIVSCDRDISVEAIKEAVRKAGYVVVE